MLDPNLRTPWLGEKIFHSFLWHILNSFEAKLWGHIFYLNLITQLWHSFPVTPKFRLAASTPAPKCIRSTQIFFFLKYQFCFLCSALRPSFECTEVEDTSFYSTVHFMTVLGFSAQIFVGLVSETEIFWSIGFWKSMKLHFLILILEDNGGKISIIL